MAHLNFLRAVAEATAQGVTQTEIAREMGVTQPAVSQLLSTAAQAAGAVRAGFSGASPYEICQRFAAGKIDRAPGRRARALVVRAARGGGWVRLVDV